MTLDNQSLTVFTSWVILCSRSVRSVPTELEDGDNGSCGGGSGKDDDDDDDVAVENGCCASLMI